MNSALETVIGDFIPSIPCNNFRSLVPDLLFEDIQAERILEIKPYLQIPEMVDGKVPLHRVTVFLTYACNLDCPYCKTIARSAEELQIFPQKAVQFNYETFERLLLSLEDAPIRHLHFTGGEAGLIRDLPKMVQLARQRGVQHISITSNGTLPARVYAKLVENGIDEIRISIDARDAEMGEALTGHKKAWQLAVDNIRALAELKRKYPNFFLIANSVVSAVNRKEALEIVRFLLSLCVDDIKLIMVVQEKETLGDFPEAGSILNGIESLLEIYPSEAYPLLRRKIHTVFEAEAIGLEDVPAEDTKDWRCYIPLTERTVDGVYYYPCSVYLREGGAPLGTIGENMEMQREKTSHFVRHGKCLEDPICRQYCLHCTKTYNVAANKARNLND